MRVAISKLDAATEQLDWAIRLFFDHKAFVPAMSLAGAAEEILGAPLGDASLFAVLRGSLADEFKLPASVVSQQHLNRGKNWVKHWTHLKDDEVTMIDLEGDARQLIARAMSNFLDHDLPLTVQGKRFRDWAIQQTSGASEN